MVKSMSSNKLKPNLFPEVGNSISYVIMVASRIGVSVRSRSHGTKLSLYELVTRLMDPDEGVKSR